MGKQLLDRNRDAGAGDESRGVKRPPIILVGKGPSAAVVRPPDGYHVGALNGAVQLCPGRVDWLFVNDYEALDEVPNSCLDRVGTLVIPTALHVHGGGRLYSAHELPAGLWDRVAIQLYRLPSHKRLNQSLTPEAFGDSNLVPTFGQVWSVGESSVAYLLHEGYREFRTVGIDARPGYSGAFSGFNQTPKPASWFAENVRRIRQRVQDAGGTITPFSS
jgi:hypothetical protein